MINFKIVLNVLSIISFFISLLMLIPLSYAAIVGESTQQAFALSFVCTIVLSAILFFSIKPKSKAIGKREGYLIVSLGWICIAIFSSLPYYFSGLTNGAVDSLFESVSGLTTTGATIFTDIEILPRCLLLWRSMTQWIGGMGIIVLTVALFPLLGIGGVELFVAESPGPTSNKIHPRIKETAKRLWLLYVMLTVLLIVILWFEGMTAFDAFNHGLTTIATGGFSTKNASIMNFSPLIQYTLMLFMFIAGINYSLIYVGIKGKFGKIWSSDEFRAYVYFLSLSILFVTSAFYVLDQGNVEVCFRNAGFQIVSMVTTTGFVITDYTLIHPLITLFFFFLLFAGACAGSTAGGIKFIRHIVFFKNSTLEFKRLLHPNALIRIRIDNKIVAPRILTHVLVFLLIYLLIFLIGTFFMTFILADFQEPLLSAAGAVATTLGNVGPAISQLGPTDNFALIPPSGKMFLSLIMLLGRLELFSILILFTPYFWRIN